MSERQTCFKSQTCDLAKMRDNEVHNTRAWTAAHSAPGYILTDKNWDPRGNISMVNRKLTPGIVLEQAAAHNIHRNSQLLREAIVVTKESTDKPDLARLWRALEKDWGIRVMYMHLHRDEGHVKPKSTKAKQESPEVEVIPTKLNWHVHVGYTQLRADGSKAPVDRDAMEQAQDICARALNMPRGVRGSERRGLSHKEWRKVAPLIDALKEEAALEKVRADTLADKNAALLDEQSRLKDENKRLRGLMKESGQAGQADYQALKKIRESDMPFDEKLTAMEELAQEVIERTKENESRAQAAEQRADELGAANAGLLQHRLIDDLPAGPMPPWVMPPAPAAPPPATPPPAKKRLENRGDYEARVREDTQRQIDRACRQVVAPWVDWRDRLAEIGERIRARWAALHDWRNRLQQLVAGAASVHTSPAGADYFHMVQPAAESGHKNDSSADNVPMDDFDAESDHNEAGTGLPKP